MIGNLGDIIKIKISKVWEKTMPYIGINVYSVLDKKWLCILLLMSLSRNREETKSEYHIEI